jgi:hypothetical protein
MRIRLGHGGLIRAHPEIRVRLVVRTGFPRRIKSHRAVIRYCRRQGQAGVEPKGCHKGDNDYRPHLATSEQSFSLPEETPKAGAKFL